MSNDILSIVDLPLNSASNFPADPLESRKENRKSRPTITSRMKCRGSSHENRSCEHGGTRITVNNFRDYRSYRRRYARDD